MRGERGAGGPEDRPVGRFLDLPVGQEQVLEIRGRGHRERATVQVEACLVPGEARREGERNGHARLLDPDAAAAGSEADGSVPPTEQASANCGVTPLLV